MMHMLTFEGQKLGNIIYRRSILLIYISNNVCTYTWIGKTKYTITTTNLRCFTVDNIPSENKE
jgi:hypothetical protein